MKWFAIIKIFMSLNQYKKILVIKHGSLGDITFALSAMNSIRFYFKNSKITLLTESKFLNFLKKSQYFDRFLIDNRKGLLKTVFVILRIFHNDYNLIIDLQNSKRTNFYNFIFRILSRVKISGSRSNAHYRYIIPEQGSGSATAGLFKQLSMLNIVENKTDYDWLDIDLNIITLLKEDRKVDKPIHKPEFFKPLKRENIIKAIKALQKSLIQHV